MAFRYGWRGPTIVSDGLILYLDAGSPNSYRTDFGTTWKDISGNRIDGTFTNGPTFNSDNGGSIVFDGVNDYVDLADGFANFTGGITLEAWTYPTANANPQIVLRLVEGVSANQIIFYRAVGGGGGRFCVIDVGTNVFNGPDDWALNTWQLYTVTLNGTNLFMYRNGIQTYTQATTVLPTNITRTNNKVAEQNGEGFTGRIAITRVYNRALSATEILQNYNATKSRFGL